MKKLIILSILGLAFSGCGKDSSHESKVDNGVASPTGAAVPGPSTATPVKDPTTPPVTDPNPGGSTGTGTGSGTGSAGGSTGSGSGGTAGTAPTDPPVCKSGPIGTYNGYIKRADGSIVPLSLIVDIRKSNDSGIPLRATMRVGFLGGVSIGTETVNYDWTNNFLSVVFGGTSTGGSTGASGATATPSGSGSTPSVQIIGTLACGALVGGQIHGNLSGFQNIVLSKSEKSLFDDSKKDYTYALNFASHPQTSSYLTITPRVSGVTSSETSDLPYLPSLTATMQFPGVGATVQPFDYTLYDPLRGTLELTFLGYSIFKCPVVVNDLKGELSAPALNCDVTMGASIVDKVAAVAGSGVPPLRPPRYFVGYSYPSPTLKYYAVATLDYEDKDMKNPISSIFPNYPVLDLKITVCDGPTAAQRVATERVTYETVSLDPISSKAIFRFLKTGGENFDLDVTYGPSFLSFVGEVQSAQTSPGAQNSRYEFTALSDKTQWRTCATPIP